MSIQCKAWYLSHRGKARPVNEDSLLVGDLIVRLGDMTEAVAWRREGTSPFCVCVADGMGGHKGGARASALCCEELARMDDVNEEQLRERLQEINYSIFDEADSNPNLAGMGTTVAGMAMMGEDVVAFNLGDSRVYRIEGHSMNLLTKDHTAAQALEDAGMWKRGEVRPPALHSLTQALGGAMSYHDVTPQIDDCPFDDRASFLLCTDGLTDMLSLSRMEEQLSLEKPELIVNGLFEAAMDKGGKDNLTIVYLEVERSP